MEKDRSVKCIFMGIKCIFMGIMWWRTLLIKKEQRDNFLQNI